MYSRKKMPKLLKENNFEKLIMHKRRVVTDP